METLEEVRARVERIVRGILTKREATRHPNSLAVPVERNSAAEVHRMLDAYQASIGGGFTGLLRVGTRMQRPRNDRATAERAIAEFHRRAAASRTEVEKHAWLEGAAFLRDGATGFYERPGALIAIEREWGIGQLQTLPTIAAELEKVEAEFAEHVARLISEMDAWDAYASSSAASVK